jgi:O-antigen/teichoic acid export membrane protein
MTAILGRLRKSTTTVLGRNTIWMTLSQFTRLGLQMVYFVLVARALGPRGYGAFVGVAALVAIIVPFANLGTGNLLIKEVARDPSCFPLWWGRSLLALGLGGPLLTALGLAFGRLLLPPEVPLSAILLFCLAELLFAKAVETAAQAYQAVQRLGRTGQLHVLLSIVRTAAAAILLFGTGEPSLPAWARLYFISSAAAALLALSVATLELGRPKLSTRMSLRDLEEGFYFAMAQCAAGVYFDIDKTMLVRMSTLQATGIYGAAWKVTTAAFSPIRSLMFAAYPRFFKHGAEGVEGSYRFAKRILPAAAGYGLLVGIVLWCGAPLLAAVVGKGFSEATTAIRWFAVVPVIDGVYYIAADILTGAGLQRVRTIIYIVAAGLNVGLNLILIPAQGWLGACWATVATESLLAVALWSVVLYYRRAKAICLPVSAAIPTAEAT